MRLDINVTGDIRLIVETQEDLAALALPADACKFDENNVGVIHLLKCPFQIHDRRALTLSKSRHVE